MDILRTCLAVALIALAIVLLLPLRLALPWGERVRLWRSQWRPLARTRTRLAAFLGLSLVLAACATAQLTAGKTLATAQTSVATAATAAHGLYLSGLLSHAKIVTIAGWTDQADDVSLTARCAYSKGDLSTVAGAFAELAALAAAIVATNTGQTIPAIPGFVTSTCANPAPVAAVTT